MTKRLLRLSAVTAVTLSLTTGVAAANSGMISDTGRDSHNEVKSSSWDSSWTKNTNNLGVTNDNPQTAHTGGAHVYDNEDGGDALSGDAENGSTLSGTFSATNSGASAASSVASDNTGSVSGTGRDSYNKVTVSSTSLTSVSNTNNVAVSNTNTQTAQTGDASVHHNEVGGVATSGAATNTSNTTLSVSVSN